MRVGMRARHSYDDGDTHVPASRPSKMRLHGESEVRYEQVERNIRL